VIRHLDNENPTQPHPNPKRSQANMHRDTEQETNHAIIQNMTETTSQIKTGIGDQSWNDIIEVKSEAR